MKISFTTLGCKLNFAESSSLGKALIARGHTCAKAGEQADICVINTCSVTDAADHKDRQAIHHIRRQNPNAILIVTGCYAQLKPGEIAEIEDVDYVLGQDEKFSLPDFIEHLENENEAIYTSHIREVDAFHSAHSRDDRTRCFLKVQDGCNYFCTYCTIPLARGKSRNPSIDSLVTEAAMAIHEGAKEIVLTGVNIGDFGHSTGETFQQLVESLDNLPVGDNPYRIRISSCEPNLLSDDIIDYVAKSKHFAPHFHIPLQSGSNEVLAIMHRRYTRELFEERISHIKQVMPNAFIGVDCMVGVRGEKEEYFQDYLDFIEHLPVSQLHVFTYSERANTHMLDMDLLIVPQKERERRSHILHEVSNRKLENFYKNNRNGLSTVLWEGKRITRDNGDPYVVIPSQTPDTYPSLEMPLMFGFTENYIRIARPYDKSRINTYESINL